MTGALTNNETVLHNFVTNMRYLQYFATAFFIVHCSLLVRVVLRFWIQIVTSLSSKNVVLYATLHSIKYWKNWQTSVPNFNNPNLHCSRLMLGERSKHVCHRAFPLTTMLHSWTDQQCHCHAYTSIVRNERANKRTNKIFKSLIQRTRLRANGKRGPSTIDRTNVRESIDKHRVVWCSDKWSNNIYVVILLFLSMPLDHIISHR